MKRKMNMAWCLGHYVGEYIVAKYLPSLSVGCGYTNNVIQVSDEDTQAYNLINEALHTTEKTDSKYNPKDWNAYILKSKELDEKYLPKELKCFIPDI